MSFYCVIHKSKAAIDQFIDALNSIDSLVSQLKNHPLLFKELFCANSGNLSINEFRKLCKINFSPVGCNNRSGEEKSILWREEMLDNLPRKEEFDGISFKELLTFVPP
jgi:Asp-tRNA(Asn)/Glu-tRNA(Gln) amidotransferase C subunit